MVNQQSGMDVVVFVYLISYVYSILLYIHSAQGFLVMYIRSLHISERLFLYFFSFVLLPCYSCRVTLVVLLLPYMLLLSCYSRRVTLAVLLLPCYIHIQLSLNTSYILMHRTFALRKAHFNTRSPNRWNNHYIISLLVKNVYQLTLNRRKCSCQLARTCRVIHKGKCILAYT